MLFELSLTAFLPTVIKSHEGPRDRAADSWIRSQIPLEKVALRVLPIPPVHPMFIFLSRARLNADDRTSHRIPSYSVKRISYSLAGRTAATLIVDRGRRGYLRANRLDSSTILHRV